MAVRRPNLAHELIQKWQNDKSESGLLLNVEVYATEKQDTNRSLSSLPHKLYNLGYLTIVDLVVAHYRIMLVNMLLSFWFHLASSVRWGLPSHNERSIIIYQVKIFCCNLTVSSVLKFLKSQVMELDLLSLDSIVRFAEAWNSRNAPLHVLLNNAGIFSIGGLNHFYRLINFSNFHVKLY